MTSKKLQGRSKKELADMARRKGIAGCTACVRRAGRGLGGLALALRAANGHAAHANGNGKTKLTVKPRHRARPQLAAARSTSNGISAEENGRTLQFDVGVPTRDLSAKVPRDLPTGYGKDRIVVMVRDPYWLHAYWELTRQAVARAEAALARNGTEPSRFCACSTSPHTTRPRRPKPSCATSKFTAAAITGTSTSVIRPVLIASTSDTCRGRATLCPRTLQRGKHAPCRRQRRHRRKLGRH